MLLRTQGHPGTYLFHAEQRQWLKIALNLQKPPDDPWFPLPPGSTVEPSTTGDYCPQNPELQPGGSQGRSRPGVYADGGVDPLTITPELEPPGHRWEQEDPIVSATIQPILDSHV